MKDSRDFSRLPLGSLIVRCAMPAMVSMSAMALYSVIDGVFVGYFLGASALSIGALALLVPCLGLTGVWRMPLGAGLVSATVSLICLRRLAF